ncbi:hypothetical protein MPG78_06785 [Helicobacter pylori]|nr:hypothetical protein [Helicobacter pylori]UOS01481.1 hypothetical protein MPG78_06785 [Helicobacter pylori]
MKEETNIVGIYNEHYLLSEKSNLVGALKLEGISYLSLDDKEIAQKFNERILALNEIVDGVHFKIVAKRRKIFMHHGIYSRGDKQSFCIRGYQFMGARG